MYHNQLLMLLLMMFCANGARTGNDYKEDYPFHDAVKNGNTTFIREQIERDFSNAMIQIFKKDNDDNIPLHYVAQSGDGGTLRLLLNPNGQFYSKDTDVDARNKFDKTPLHFAAQNGQADTVFTLVNDFGATVDAKDSIHDSTPLFYAADGGYHKTVAALLKLKANPDERNKTQSTALHYAAANGHDQSVYVLLQKITSTVDVEDKDGRTPLIDAADGNVKTVRLLVKARADVKKKCEDGKTVLHYAAAFGNYEIARELILNLNVDIKEKSKLGYTPLHLAANSGKYETVHVLVTELNADVEEKTDREDLRALHIAVAGGHLETVKVLVKELKANVNAKTTYGKTPLEFAVKKQGKEMILLLIELRADIATKNHHGIFVIDKALNQGSITMADIANSFNNMEPSPFVTNELRNKFRVAFHNRKWEMVEFLTTNNLTKLQIFTKKTSKYAFE